MRTTIDISEHLLVEAKRIGAEQHLSFTKVVEESLRRCLSDLRKRPAERPLMELPTLSKPRPLGSLDNTSARLGLE